MKLFIIQLRGLLTEFSKFFRRNPNKLGIGRWRLEDCNKKINKKVDFANEDHCGPCGNNLLRKRESV